MLLIPFLWLALTTYVGRQYTSACWSLHRPCIFFVGRSDGLIDIWDLSDTSYRPSSSQPVCSPHAVECLIPAHARSCMQLSVVSCVCSPCCRWAAGSAVPALGCRQLSRDTARGRTAQGACHTTSGRGLGLEVMPNHCISRPCLPDCCS